MDVELLYFLHSLDVNFINLLHSLKNEEIKLINNMDTKFIEIFNVLNPLVIDILSGNDSSLNILPNNQVIINNKNKQIDDCLKIIIFYLIGIKKKYENYLFDVLYYHFGDIEMTENLYEYNDAFISLLYEYKYIIFNI